MDTSRLGSAREEAERLVATGLAVASTALRGMEANRQLRGLAEQVLGSDRMHDLAAGLAGFVSGLGGDDGGAAAGSLRDRSAGAAAGWSTGSADCCVCPVCRLIAALRDPSPEFAERLASSAGDLAVGISGLLRVLSGVVSKPGTHAEHGQRSAEHGQRSAEHGQRSAGQDPWHAATTAPSSAGYPSTDAEPGPGASAATAAGAYSTPTMAAAGPASASEPAASGTTAKKPVAKKPTAKKAVAKKAVAKKAVAKKAVRTVVPGDPDDGRQER